MPLTTVCRILKEKESVIEAFESGSQAKRIRLKTGKHEQIEEAVVTWLKQIRSQNIPISGDLLKEKALVIANQLQINDFKASEGWLTNFKQRHGIRFKGEQGEAGAVDVCSLRSWQQQVLQDSLASFQADDIFNADETGLFWQLLPNKTMTMKDDQCTGGKKSKERITVLVCTNMSGTEKLPLLVIERSAKPRCFKNKNIPVDYEANRKAWMTGAIFEAYLAKWDKRLKNERRKVLLYLDNCSAHPTKLKLNNITIKFFPPNTTAVSQPMDQGIIQNLKIHYRKLLLRHRIAQIEGAMNYKMELLDHLLRRGWDQVTKETIKNCFRHANFILKDSLNEEEGIGEVGSESDEAFDGLLNAWDDLQNLGGIDTDAAMQDFINIDDLVITTGALSLAEIVADVLRTEEESSEGSDNEATEVEALEVEKPISRLEAQSAFAMARHYVERNCDDPAVLSLTDALDEYFLRRKAKKTDADKNNQLLLV